MKNSPYFQHKVALQRGSILAVLLIFVAMGLLATSVAIVVLADQLQAGTRENSSTSALLVAESGAENAILRLLRNPAYTGETLPVNLSQAVVSVTGTDPIVIESTGTAVNISRTVRVELRRINGSLLVESWKEVAE